MRLFVALTPPPEAIADLERAIAPQRARWPELRWAAPERWHVTLAFLGEVDEAKLPDLRARMERAAGRHHELDIRVGRGGAFPSATKARVLVAHIEGEPDALAALRVLAASVAAGARRAGAPPPDEARRYRPHLTIARTRQPADLGDLVGALAGQRGPAWQASDIHLIRSHTGPNSRYETLNSWPLRRG